MFCLLMFYITCTSSAYKYTCMNNTNTNVFQTLKSLCNIHVAGYLSGRMVQGQYMRAGRKQFQNKIIMQFIANLSKKFFAKTYFMHRIIRQFHYLFLFVCFVSYYLLFVIALRNEINVITMNQDGIFNRHLV